MPRTKDAASSLSSSDSDINDSLDLNADILSALKEIPHSHHYLIGLSGGLDSLALIHFCVPYLRQITSNITVIHVHHGLSTYADDWADFCAQVCQSAGLEMMLERVLVQAAGEGLEAAARKARYQVFSKFMQAGSVLLLGHHLNDQAETVLMRLIKGLGPAALRGMAKRRTFSGGEIFRPWINLKHSVLAAEMKKVAGNWVDDESNNDRRFERNFIRHEVLPVLEQRRPSVLSDLQHTAERCAEYVEFVEDWCRQHENKFLSSTYSKEKAIDLQSLKQFSDRQQRFILRYWFDVMGIQHPAETNFARIISDLILPEVPSKAEVVWKDLCLRAFDGALFCLRAGHLISDAYEYLIPLDDILDRGNLPFSLELPSGTLFLEHAGSSSGAGSKKNESTNTAYCYELTCSIPKAIKVLVIRSRGTGERIKLHEGCTQSLKKLYQSHRVLPWHREHVPIIELRSTMDGSEMTSDSASKNLISLAGFLSYPMKEDPLKTAHQIRFRYITRNGLLD